MISGSYGIVAIDEFTQEMLDNTCPLGYIRCMEEGEKTFGPKPSAEAG